MIALAQARSKRLFEGDAPMGDNTTHLTALDGGEQGDEHIAKLLELSLDLMCTAGFDGRLRWVSKSFETVLGRPRAELLARPFFDFVHPDDVAATVRAMESLSEGKAVIDFRNRYAHADGSYRWLQWRSRSDADLELVVAIARDITEQVRRATLAEQAHEIARVGGWELDLAADSMFWTRNMFRLVDADPGAYEPTWDGLLALHDAKNRDQLRDAVAQARAERCGFSLDLALQTCTGRDITGRYVARFDDEADRSRLLGSFQDITEMRETTRRLDETNALLRAAIEQSPAGILIADAPSGTIRVANPAALGIRGTTEEVVTEIPVELHPTRWQTFHADGSIYRPEDLPLSRAVLFGETTRDVEVIIRRDGGEERWVLGNAGPVRDADGNVIAGVVVFPDITDRKRAERERERFHTMLAESPDFVSMAVPDGTTTFVNRAGRTMLGLAADADVSHMTPLDYHPPDLRHTLAAAFDHAAEHGAWAGEAVVLAHDGERIPVWQLLLAHRDGTGAVAFFSTVMRDLRQQKALEERLLHSQRLEAIGRLAGGVAHDFNNLLTVILSGAALLGRAPTLSPADRAHATAIQAAAEQAAGVTNQLLAFARRQLIEPRVVQVDELVSDIGRLLRRVLGETIALDTTTSPGVWPIRIDRGQFEQVLVNLAVNARDAMPRGGRLSISTCNSSAPATVGASLIEAADCVLITVSDTGHGIASELQLHVFEPFVTSKAPGEGTGLGLATCHGIVEQHGGHIEFDTHESEGTTFRIYFPRWRGDETPEPEAREPEVVADRTETILLVEDEPLVRNVAVIVLEELGYRVLAAGNADEALRSAGETDAGIDLLLTDVVLPGRSGKELAADLQSTAPELRVLFVSGYSADIIGEHGVVEDGVHFLQKPYTPKQLEVALRRALE